MTQTNEQDEKSPYPPEVEWWHRFCGPAAVDRGVRARLRRARNAQEALGEPAAIVLVRMLRAAPSDAVHDDERTHRALDLARVLACVREDAAGTRLMREAGWASFPGDRAFAEVPVADRPRLSPQRFRRLLVATGGEEVVRAFTRLIELLDGRASVTQLRWDFLLWTHPERGDEIRRRWAFEYFHAGAPAKTTTSF
mgnify:CR=1 FL=1